MRLIQLTDTHIYADRAARFEGLDTRASLEQVLRHIAGGPANDAVVITGDVSMDGLAEGYRWLSALLADLSLSAIAIPGNHDQPDAWSTPSGAGFVTTPSSLSLPPWHLHFLDTRVAGAPHGEIAASSLNWLDGALAQHADAFHAIFMHHPPFCVGSVWLDRMGLVAAERLWDVVCNHAGVRAIVSGHVHQNFDSHWHSVRVLTSPSTCVQFAPRTLSYAVDARAPGYRLFEFADDGGISTEVVRVASARLPGQ